MKLCVGAMNKKTVTEKPALSCVILGEAVEDCYIFPADETEQGEPEPDMYNNGKHIRI
jgi:hypothetical protein